MIVRVLLSLLVLLALPLLRQVGRFFTNYMAARHSNAPMRICPLNPNAALWIIFSVPLRPVINRWLPAAWAEMLMPAIYGWEFLDRGRLVARMGRDFMLVTTGQNELWLTEREAVGIMLARPKDFLTLDTTREIMGLFGPNVLTVDGESWQRQRRIIAPVLNERIMSLVWRESSKQAQEMVESFTDITSGLNEKTRGGETDLTIEGLQKIAINVLIAAGYGQSRSWKHEQEEAPLGHKMSFIGAIATITKKYTIAAFIPRWILRLPFAPELFKKVAIAMEDFPLHTKEMLEKERISKASTQNNLMSTLVKLSDNQKSQEAANSKSRLHLSEDEIAGNLYLFTIAGYDTTANTMAYAFAHLAIQPKLQDWLIEEIDRVSACNPDFDYEHTWPSLKRCVALMYETLRLYTPIQHICRQTNAPQTIVTASKTYNISKSTKVFVSCSSLHVDSDNWAPDPLVYRPSRWLDGDGGHRPRLIEAAKSTFLPWSVSPRSCPGMKMSQVEFVAVVSTVLRSCRLEPILEPDETLAMAQARLASVLADSQPLITLQMNRPRDVKLRWVRR